MIGKINLIAATMEEKSLNEKHCPHVTAKLRQIVEKMDTDADALVPKIQNAVSFDEVHGYADDVTMLVDQKTAVANKIQEQLDSVKYKKGIVVKAFRAEYQTKRWVRTKIVQTLVVAGHGNGFAKHMAELIASCQEGSAKYLLARLNKDDVNVSIDPKTSEFRPTLPTMWSPDQDGVAKLLVAALSAHKVALDTSCQQLHDVLIGEPRWAGSQQWLKDIDMQIDFFKENEEVKSEMCVGRNPWMLSARCNQKRSSPAACPSPGLPCLLFAKTHAMYVHVSEVATILEQGMALSNFDKFVNSEEGSKHMSTKAFCIRLPQGCVMYIPPGCLWGFTWHVEVDKKAKKKAPQEEEFCDLMVFPTITKELMDGLAESVKKACHVFNSAGLRDKTMQMWDTRKKLLDEVFKTS